MASPLRLIASHLLTRSRFHPAVTVAINHAASFRPKVDLRSRDITTSAHSAFDQWSRHSGMNLKPITRSLALTTVGKYLSLDVPGLAKTESNDVLCLFLHMPGVEKKDVKVYVKHETNSLVIQGKTHEISYEGRMRFPENVDKTGGDIKGEIMKDGMYKLTLPKLKHNKELKTSIFANFKSKLSFHFSGTYVYVLRLLYEYYIIHESLQDRLNSFTVYKEKTAESQHVSSIPGIEKVELTTEGACVSLNMSGLEIEDVKSYFRHDILFIEGKKKTKTRKVHYITGIPLPKSILKKPKKIKTEMQNGIYKASLPRVTEEIKVK